jgi:hypothetical protein
VISKKVAQAKRAALLNPLAIPGKLAPFIKPLVISSKLDALRLTLPRLIVPTRTMSEAMMRHQILHRLDIPRTEAFSNPRANCEHVWEWVSDNRLFDVLCDFNTPHTINGGLASVCQFCQSVACTLCAT